MPEVAERAREFLNELFSLGNLDLRAEISDSPDSHILNLEGADAPLLRMEGGELLDAVEHLINQAFSSELPHEQHLVCDVEGFRAVRETELRAMARHAASRVLSTGAPFLFGPMSAKERRVIHVSLAGEENLLTESVGEGNERRLKVSLKKSL
jgi:spoIIIJ-associated protein